MMSQYRGSSSAAKQVRPDLLSYTPPDTPIFPDVSANYWSYKFVEYLAAEDIVRGYDDGSYRPEEVVTRD